MNLKRIVSRVARHLLKFVITGLAEKKSKYSCEQNKIRRVGTGVTYQKTNLNGQLMRKDGK